MIRKNLYILFLLASVYSFAQVNLYSEVNTKEARVNNPFVFTVVLEIFGEDLAMETPIKLPDLSKFDFAVSSEQSTFIDPVKKIRINQIVCQVSLDPKQAGSLRVGSALVKVNGKVYKTEPIDIIVKEPEKKALATVNNLSKNMYVNMQVADRDVYKNEPVIAVLKAFSRNISGFRHLEPAKFEHTKNFVIRSIANVDESIEETDNDFSSQVVAMFVIVPKTVGVLDIPPAEVPLSNHKNMLTSNKVKINVKKLPEGAPESFNNAVGKFEAKIELIDKNKENFEINKAFNVAVKIKGNGNLSPSILPKILPSSDYETFEPKIINNSIATTEGIEGEVEAQYVIIPKKRGDIRISTEDFSYFDPKQEKYIEIGSKFLALNAVNAQDIANAKSTLQKVNEYTNNVLEKVDSPVMSTQKLKIKEHKSFNWLGIFGNLLIIAFGAIVFIYFNKRRKEKKKSELEKKTVAHQPIINIEETEELLRNKKKFETDSYFNYLHNRLNGEDASQFFQAFEELKTDADQYCQDHYSSTFSEYLKANFGLSIYEKYNQLITEVNIEKFSPFSTKEKQAEILDDIKEVYKLL